ncbi:UNVERIFIED_CONTAM: hypothetical protein FKN15_059975 [Acipenser sinensis]
MEEEMSSNHTLVATLQRRFSSTGKPELLRARFRRRVQMAGEAAMGLGELHKYLLLAKPQSLQTASNSPRNGRT